MEIQRATAEQIHKAAEIAGGISISLHPLPTEGILPPNQRWHVELSAPASKLHQKWHTINPITRTVRLSSSRRPGRGAKVNLHGHTAFYRALYEQAPNAVVFAGRYSFSTLKEMLQKQAELAQQPTSNSQTDPAKRYTYLEACGTTEDGTPIPLE